jgi:hypothetical protein
VAIYPARCPHTGADVWHVKGYGVYEESSVLHGQQRVVHLDTCDTEAEARRKWECAVIECGRRQVWAPGVPRSPESWFDPMNAGEAWGEDDY